jgi:glycosyltransferase involved in cell wall biosynthesis
VLLAVWNPNPAYVELAIRSILAQSFHDFELLIVEDPSPTSVAELVASLDDDRVRLLQRSTRGTLGAALNAGLAEARADLVARIDADDVAVPERLTRQVAFLRANPEIAVYGSRVSVIDDRGRVLGRRLLPLAHDAIGAALRRYNCISHPSVMYRKAAVLALGGYDESRVAEDYDLWCRLLLAGARFRNADEDFVHYRFHEEAAKYRGVHDAIRVTIAIKKRYFRDRFTWGDRIRLMAEQTLLRMPAALIIALFRFLEYRGGASPRAA